MLMKKIIKMHKSRIFKHKKFYMDKFKHSERDFIQIYNLYTSLTFITIFNQLTLAKGQEYGHKSSPTNKSVNEDLKASTVSKPK